MLVPALHFPGTCADAIAFYQKVFGAQVISIAYNKEAPPDASLQSAASHPHHVMHAELVIAQAHVNMCDASDTVVPGNMHLFNLFLDTVEQVVEAYHHLSADGRVITALGPQFWTPMYADVADQFGVHWQLMAK